MYEAIDVSTPRLLNKTRTKKKKRKLVESKPRNFYFWNPAPISSESITWVVLFKRENIKKVKSAPPYYSKNTDSRPCHAMHRPSKSPQSPTVPNFVKNCHPENRENNKKDETTTLKEKVASVSPPPPPRHPPPSLASTVNIEWPSD